MMGAGWPLSAYGPTPQAKPDPDRVDCRTCWTPVNGLWPSFDPAVFTPRHDSCFPPPPALDREGKPVK